MVGIGSQLGGYSLTASLGRGGFASLYLGQKSGPGGFSRLAAVKVVHPHLATESKFRLMFTDEARLNTRVQHPNIVRVEDFGEQDGTLYMVMEYVYGCSLAEVLQTLSADARRMSVPLAVWIVMQVADALHAAHEARDESGKPWAIVHRDVSPQNVLLSYAGYVKLIDFGIAKARYRAQVTRTGGVKGKLRYMAPEQALSKQIDRRIDVYALGVVAWEMLTMRRAVEAKTPIALLQQIRDPQIPRASTYADVPRAVDEAIAAAMCPDPSGRPRTARDLRRMLALACPEALFSEPGDLAELLDAAMRPHRRDQAGRLPTDVSLSLEKLAAPAPLANATEVFTDSLSEAVEPWQPAEEDEVEELSVADLIPEDLEVFRLLERVAAETTLEAPQTRDTIQESRREVLARLAERDLTPRVAPTVPPGPRAQRHLPTMPVERAPSTTIPVAAIAAFLAVMALAVAVFAFVVIRALL